MAWTAEDRRKYAPAIQEALRQGMLVRLATTIDTIDPPAKTGRPRDWSTVTMLGALWHLARDGCVWRRLPAGFPPFTTVWCRLRRWRALATTPDHRPDRCRSSRPGSPMTRPAPAGCSRSAGPRGSLPGVWPRQGLGAGPRTADPAVRGLRAPGLGHRRDGAPRQPPRPAYLV